ncbi:MAG: SigB/SigF/SigG family RNA polymerase sigma factor [Clostridia bacterium]|nr:SigB/SigF/SigG family RNA polymerase sigma factor [Clostridia bacterium]
MSKVVICGIDTSSLPKCTNEKSNELMDQIKKGKPGAKEEFIMLNMRLVLSIIKRFNISENNSDDVFQVGMIGLIKSIDNFDTSLGVKFSTYAVPMIIGEIRRYIRDNNAVKVSRRLRDIAYQAMQAKQQLLKTCASDPTIDQIAQALEVPVRDVAFALDAISEPVSLYEQVYGDDNENMLVMDQIKDLQTENNMLEQTALKEALDSLDEREKQILMLRYFDGKTQTEISEEIGISQAQVSRLEKDAISLVKKMI